MKRLIHAKLNIFDYLVIAILVIIIVYASVTKIYSIKKKNTLQNINIYTYCENVPLKAREGLTQSLKIYAGSKELNFGIIKEYKAKRVEPEKSFFTLELTSECIARKNENGGYVIDGTTYYLGQEVKLFLNSTLISGYIYDIKESNE